MFVSIAIFYALDIMKQQYIGKNKTEKKELIDINIHNFGKENVWELVKLDYYEKPVLQTGNNNKLGKTKVNSATQDFADPNLCLHIWIKL